MEKGLSWVLRVAKGTFIYGLFLNSLSSLAIRVSVGVNSIGVWRFRILWGGGRILEGARKPKFPAGTSRRNDVDAT